MAYKNFKMKDLPPMDFLNDTFAFNLDGELIWKSHERSKHLIGEVAGTRTARGYYRVVLNNSAYSRHRIVYAITHGYDPKDALIDHRNGIRGDDRADNLRLADNDQNLFNRGKNSNNKSGFKGVCWSNEKQKWRATISARGNKNKHIGYFDSPVVAHSAYVAESSRLHGEYAHA